MNVDQIKNIRNVRKLYMEDDAYIVDVDIFFQDINSYEQCEYCCRFSGNYISKLIIEEINKGNFSGTIKNFSYPTEEELLIQEATSVRNERNLLLEKSDWTQLPDVPEETKLKWQPYRQELRDITNQPGFPSNIIWPVPPQ